MKRIAAAVVVLVALACAQGAQARTSSAGESLARGCGKWQPFTCATPTLQLERERWVWESENYWLCRLAANPDGTVNPACGWIPSRWVLIPDSTSCRIQPLPGSDYPTTVCEDQGSM